MKEPGEMNSPEDVYSWLIYSAFNCKISWKKNGKDCLQGGIRHTTAQRLIGVRYYEERIRNIESIKQDIGKISTPLR